LRIIAGGLCALSAFHSLCTLGPGRSNSCALGLTVTPPCLLALIAITLPRLLALTTVLAGLLALAAITLTRFTALSPILAGLLAFTPVTFGALGIIGLGFGRLHGGRSKSEHGGKRAEPARIHQLLDRHDRSSLPVAALPTRRSLTVSRELERLN